MGLTIHVFGVLWNIAYCYLSINPDPSTIPNGPADHSVTYGSASPDGRYNVQHTGKIRVRMRDGSILLADATIPTTPLDGLESGEGNDLFPVVIFTNSWACPRFEYAIQSKRIAAMGYVVLEYEARGWFESDGKINMAGPLDQSDSVSMIDYALSRADWRVDPARVAMAGISYGWSTRAHTRALTHIHNHNDNTHIASHPRATKFQAAVWRYWLLRTMRECRR